MNKELGKQIMDGIKSGLQPFDKAEFQRAYEMQAKREKRTMDLLGISEEELAVIREMRWQIQLNCAMYGHRWRDVAGEIQCVSCGEYKK